MGISTASDSGEVPMDASALAKAIAASLAEDIAHEALLGVDPTAVHLGGRTRAHDHEIFSGTEWIETKSGWYQPDGKSKGVSNRNRLFFSSVNWSARVLKTHSLAAVAIVPLRAEYVRELKGRGRVSFEYEVDHFFVIPALELNKRATVHSNGRSSVDLDWALQYRIDNSNPLTLSSLQILVKAGQFIGAAAA